MTDSELRDQAVLELKATTVGYTSSPAPGGCHHTWTVPPAGTHWATALDLLAQIAPVVTPPPPVTTYVDHLNAVSSQTYSDLFVKCPPYPARAIEIFYNIHDVTLQRVIATGGRMAHIYGSGSDVTQWPTRVSWSAVQLMAMVEDMLHVDGVNGFTMDAACRITNPTPNQGAHDDGVHFEAGVDATLRGFFQWNKDTDGSALARRDSAQGWPYGGGALFIHQSNSTRPTRNITVDRPVIHEWFGGRAMQMFVSGKIISPDIIDCGLATSPKITLNRPGDGGKIELVPASTGLWASGVVNRSDIYFNDFQGTGFPDYVIVRA